MTSEMPQILPVTPNEFLETANRISMKGPTGVISYLDFYYDKDGLSGKTKILDAPMFNAPETVIPDEGFFDNSYGKSNDGFTKIGLKQVQKFIEAKTYQVSASVMKDQISDLKVQFGVDTRAIIGNALQSELLHAMQKNLFSTYEKLGIDSELRIPKSWSKRMYTKIFKKGTPVHVGGKYDSETLQYVHMQILKMSSMIAASSRRGPADFIVVSPQVGALLMDSPSFVMPDQSKETELQNHAMYPAGRLGSIKVFVNAYMKNGNTFKIVAGRKTSNNQPGVYLAEYTKEFLNIDMARISDGDELNPSGSEKIVLKSRHAQVEVGKDPASCYLTVEFDMSPLPWWKKLLNL